MEGVNALKARAIFAAAGGPGLMAGRRLSVIGYPVKGRKYCCSFRPIGKRSAQMVRSGCGINPQLPRYVKIKTIGRRGETLPFHDVGTRVCRRCAPIGAHSFKLILHCVGEWRNPGRLNEQQKLPKTGEEPGLLDDFLGPMPSANIILDRGPPLIIRERKARGKIAGLFFPGEGGQRVLCEMLSDGFRGASSSRAPSGQRMALARGEKS